jgi:[phosphatase 2A protein]-leucine-carboxy methyltransferase
MVLGAPGDITLCKRLALTTLAQAYSYIKGHGGTGLHSPTYHLLPVDLRLDPTDSLRPLLSSPASTGTLASSAPLLSPSLPTLLLFECVLVYMSPAESSRLVQWFVDYFTVSANKPYGAVLGGIVYEMFGLGDAFGKVMLSNLKVHLRPSPAMRPH